MTFRELLKFYKNGELPNEQKEYVESEIEKHEAISEYLYDDAELPALENSAPSEKNEKQEDHFTKLIQGTIRRAFVKMGVSVGVVVLAAVMAVMFVLPDFVSAFYYDPNEIVGGSANNAQTKKMEVDLSVFTELFLPSTYRNYVIADDEGYGNYHIMIPELAAYDGRFITVSGKLEKGKLTLYDPNLIDYPTSNAFVRPADALGDQQIVGAAGTAEKAFEKLETLSDTDYYVAYFSLRELMDYESFYEVFRGKSHWCAVHLGDMTRPTLGMSMGFSSPRMNWDRETYPNLCLLDAESDLSPYQIARDAEAMQTHFRSMLSYMNDHPEVLELFDSDKMPYQSAWTFPWEDLIRYVDENGINIYGFTVTAKKDKILEIAKNDMISYVYTKPFR